MQLLFNLIPFWPVVECQQNPYFEQEKIQERLQFSPIFAHFIRSVLLLEFDVSNRVG